MEESKMVLRTEDLVKKYGKRTVVSHVSKSVKQGPMKGVSFWTTWISRNIRCTNVRRPVSAIWHRRLPCFVR